MSKTLREWFDQQDDLTVVQLARQLGCEERTIYRLFARDHFPQQRIRAEVTEVTGGQVTDADMVPANG